MDKTIRLFYLGCIACCAATGQPLFNYNDPAPFGKETTYARESDNAAIGEWWNVKLKRGLQATTNGPQIGFNLSSAIKL